MLISPSPQITMQCHHKSLLFLVFKKSKLKSGPSTAMSAIVIAYGRAQLCHHHHRHQHRRHHLHPTDTSVHSGHSLTAHQFHHHNRRPRRRHNGLFPDSVKGSFVQSPLIGRHGTRVTDFSLSSRSRLTGSSLFPLESGRDRVFRLTISRSRGKLDALVR